QEEMFDIDTDQDQNKELDFYTDQGQKVELDPEWSEDSGFASPTNDIWEEVMKQPNAEFKDEYFELNPEDLFRVNAIVDLNGTCQYSDLETAANSWILPNDSWFETNATLDMDENYPLSFLEMPADSWSLLSIEDTDVTSGLHYIDLPHNTRAEGLEDVFSTSWL
ncbi:hypothetical protein V498_09959, partial [Pseudogymnoascus sp. VKM F-4517 (FW-2822)]